MIYHLGVPVVLKRGLSVGDMVQVPLGGHMSNIFAGTVTWVNKFGEVAIENNDVTIYAEFNDEKKEWDVISVVNNEVKKMFEG